MSLRIVPSASHPTSTTNLTTTHPTNTTGPSAPSAPGLADPLRATLSPPGPTSTHALEPRLLHWRATQHALKMQSLRRTFGIAEPVRRGMELQIVRQGEWRPRALGGSSAVHVDLLMGREAEVEWEDVFGGEEGGEEGVLGEMEARAGVLGGV